MQVRHSAVDQLLHEIELYLEFWNIVEASDSE
jgi:hypothetical protein